MLRHYFTLFKVAEELNTLGGMFLAECYTQEKNALTLVLADEQREVMIECSIDPQWGALFMRSGYNRARKNTVNVFANLIGAELQGVSLPENERIVSFEFGSHRLHMEFFGGGRGNILLSDAHDTIVQAFKRGRDLVGQEYQALARPTGRLEQRSDTETLGRALNACLILTGKVYQQELARRLTVDLKSPLSQFAPQDFARIQAQALQLRKECLDGKTFYLYRDENSRPLLSLLRLQGQAPPEQTFSSISEAVRTRVTTSRREERYTKRYARSAKALEKLLAKLERVFVHLDEEKKGADRALTRQLHGELLVSQPNLHEKGHSSICVHDWEGREVSIALDPALSLLENANRLFDKARNARQAKLIREQRYEEYLEKQELAEQASKAFGAVRDEASLKQFHIQFSQLFGPMDSQSDRQQPEQRYRQFELGENYVLYVGKSSTQNDELTLRFAKPNDYWLHARGVSGSHAVLKGPGNQKPPKYILKSAASIAAYYSKARNAGLTPVVYTQKKYVRKRKGSPAGQVVLEREDVVMVRPGLPEGKAE